MTPAELKCALGYLGVSTRWFGDRVGAHPRTVVRWCDGDSLMPETVLRAVHGILTETGIAYAALRTEVQPTSGGGHLLRTYRTDHQFHTTRPEYAEFPAEWHRQMVARLAAELRPARIEYTA